MLQNYTFPIKYTSKNYTFPMFSEAKNYTFPMFSGKNDSTFYSCIVCLSDKLFFICFKVGGEQFYRDRFATVS